MRTPLGALARSYPPSVVFFLCIMSYLLGRYIPTFSYTPDLEMSKAFVTYGNRQGDTFETIPAQVNTSDESQNSVTRASNLLVGSLPPPVLPGVSGHDNYTVAPFQVLSWYPRVVLFPKFIDKKKSDHIIKLAEMKLGPSRVSLRMGDSYKEASSVRTSQGTFLSSRNDGAGVLGWLEDKIAAVTMIPAMHGETFNVLRYSQGQKYESHYDVFDPDSYGPQESMRIATMLVYLSDVEEGGETVLPLEGAAGLQRLDQEDWSFRDCSVGLRYKPRMGDALLFYSIHPNGTFERRSLHGGCPVISGEKWVATKWMRDLPR